VAITQAQFDSFLGWLNPDRELAGSKYKTIHAGLVRIFACKGLNDAEDLADETINRVIRRLPQIQENYRGEPVYYFYGVARNIILECKRRKELAIGEVDVQVDPGFGVRDEHNCLGHCLGCLSDSKRNLILDYYLYEGHRKVEHHKHMAGQLQITLGAIRSRVFQIRLQLQSCMRQCGVASRVRHSKSLVISHTHR
jgi:DNA-directed RNA polymerase specialized sigma24 family protein